MSEVRIIIIRNDPIRFAFARPVTIPPVPYYTPPPLQDLQNPDPPSGLPFNAQPCREEAKQFIEKYQSFPPMTALPMKGQRGYEDFTELLKNSVIRVLIPPDKRLQRIMDRLAVAVVQEGPQFEAMVCAQEFQNQMFQFLWDNFSAAHVYYRWRIYSLLQGDSLTEWRRTPFRMFQNGSWWIPPYPLAELTEAMPKELYHLNCLKMYPEKWMKVKDGHGGQRTRGEKTKDEKREEEEAEERRRKEKRKEKKQRKKNRMSDRRRDKLEAMISGLTPEKQSIGAAMVWCIENASYAAEICQCIYESLTIDETPLFKKISRLVMFFNIKFHLILFQTLPHQRHFVELCPAKCARRFSLPFSL